jgi:hypothetical protein
MIRTPNDVERMVLNISFISVLFSFLFYSFTTTVEDPDMGLHEFWTVVLENTGFSLSRHIF